MVEFIFTPFNTNYKPSYQLRMGYSCNNKCIHCFVRHKLSNAEEIPLSALKSIVDTIEEEMVIVTGGEPTIREELLELLQYIKSKGKIVNMQTNAYKLSDKNYFNSIKNFIDTVTIPIHSNDMDIFDAVTQIKGSGKKTFEALTNFRETNILAMTQTVINQLNYKTLLSTFDMIQDVFPGTPMNLTFPHPIGVAKSISVIPKYSEIYPYMQPVLKKYAYLIRTHYIPKCILYPYHTIIVHNVDDGDNGSLIKYGIDYIENRWQRSLFRLSPGWGMGSETGYLFIPRSNS